VLPRGVLNVDERMDGLGTSREELVKRRVVCLAEPVCELRTEIETSRWKGFEELVCAATVRGVGKEESRDGGGGKYALESGDECVG